MTPQGTILKINFNASFDASLFKSGIGIVVRNASGSVVSSRVILQTSVASSFTAEALSFKWVVRMRLELGALEVIIEGDCLTVLKKCKLKSRDTSEIGAYI